MNPEKLIEMAMLELSGVFLDDTEASVKELLAAGEPGVALETLCTQLLEYDISVSDELKNRLVAAANIMNIEVEELKMLRISSDGTR